MYHAMFIRLSVDALFFLIIWKIIEKFFSFKILRIIVFLVWGHKVFPPSITKLIPFKNDDRVDRRYTTALSTSSTCSWRSLSRIFDFDFNFTCSTNWSIIDWFTSRPLISPCFGGWIIVSMWLFFREKWFWNDHILRIFIFWINLLYGIDWNLFWTKF